MRSIGVGEGKCSGADYDAHGGLEEAGVAREETESTKAHDGSRQRRGDKGNDSL
jgi:hypothetical protein